MKLNGENYRRVIWNPTEAWGALINQISMKWKNIAEKRYVYVHCLCSLLEVCTTWLSIKLKSLFIELLFLYRAHRLH